METIGGPTGVHRPVGQLPESREGEEEAEPAEQTRKS